MAIGRLLSLLGPRAWVAAARRFLPDHEYLVTSQEHLTRREVFARVDTLTARLQALGVQRGDRVATLLPASPAAVCALFLPWVLGTWEVPLNPLLGEHELRHVLSNSGASAVIAPDRWYGRDYAALLARLLPDLPDLRAIVVTGGPPCDLKGKEHFFSLDEIMATGGQPLRVRVSASTIGRITYTSGTTGLPKGAVHTWTRYWNLAHPLSLLHLAPRVFRTVLFPFPLCYYHGALAVVATLLAGGRLILVDRFQPREMLDTIERERVTLLSGSPTMFRLLLRSPGQEERDLSSVRRIFFGTEVCPPDLAQALDARFGCPLENIYATNETGNITWTGRRDPWPIVATTVGRPAPGVRLRIVDDERQPLPTDQAGEVAVRTSQMMSGYYRDPALTAQVLDAQGWFHTGDLGVIDDDGRLCLLGRKRDVIVRGGFKIYPAEVEHFLEQHPLVRRAGVVGLPGRDGEVVCAYLELAPGAGLTAVQVREYCLGQLASFKIPQQVRFVERLPVTATGKVQRFRLREMAGEKGD
ncbi:MAG: acyl--CoA ligase [Anaerolineae bacterium]|nr:acyl--CoA ligase [Anaerolineae bacterium]